MSKNTKRKKLSTPVILLIILVSFALLLSATVLGLWLNGRRVMTDSSTLAKDSDIIEYHGKTYRYNNRISTLLLIGVDSRNDGSDNSSQQSDVIVLAALDPVKEKLSLIAIPRDTMCNIVIPKGEGESDNTAYTQLALSFAYGKDPEEGCQLCRDAVSNLFNGLPIQSYAAFYFNGIPTLNDAVGGVTVQVLDDFPFTYYYHCRNMIAGQTVTLTGEQAQTYIQARQYDQLDGNLLRMERQKQYMLALVHQTLSNVKEDPSHALSLYNTVSDYTVTNLSLDRISYLATIAGKMRFDGNMTMIIGKLDMEDGVHACLTPDRDALYQVMLDTFYDEITPEE